MVYPNGMRKLVLDASVSSFGVFVGHGVLSLLKLLWNYLETEMKLRYYET